TVYFSPASCLNRTVKVGMAAEAVFLPPLPSASAAAPASATVPVHAAACNISRRVTADIVWAPLGKGKCDSTTTQFDTLGDGTAGCNENQPTAAALAGARTPAGSSGR